MPRPTTIISPLPNLKTLVVYDIDPLCYPDDISLLILGSKKLETLKLHWSPRMRAAGEESVNLMSIFGRCVAAKYSIPIKRMAIYNLYTRFSTNEFMTVINHESSVEMTVINSMGVGHPMTVFNDESWRIHGMPPVPPNLKMIRTDHFDREGAQILGKIPGMERIYIVARRSKESTKSDSTGNTPTTPSITTPGTSAGTTANAVGTPIAMTEKQCRNLGSEYIAAIQSSHHGMRHLLLSELWVLSDEVLLGLAKSLPELEQFGFACAVPSLDFLRQVMTYMPKLQAVRLLLHPGYQSCYKFDITEPEMHLFAIATEFWRPQYKHIKYLGLGDDLVFKLGGVYFPSKKESTVNGNENSMNAKRAGPVRKVELVSRESVKHIEIWGLDTTEFDPEFP